MDWPLLITPSTLGSHALATWLAVHRGELREGWLPEHGAVLFRGFGVASAVALSEVAQAADVEPLPYTYRSSPRTAVAANVYTTTEYPAPLAIPLHCENAYAAGWPRTLLLCCVEPATQGGDTPLADVRHVLRSLPATLVDRWRERRLRYDRCYHPRIDLPWPEVFQTSSRAHVEAWCRREGIVWRWRIDDGLETRQVRPALLELPGGEERWFNQAHLFHPASLGDEVRRAMEAVLGEHELPRHCRFGDGGAIPEEDIARVSEAHARAARRFAWQQGDVLVVDNLRVAHGRDPFRGPRKLLLVMGDEMRDDAVTEGHCFHDPPPLRNERWA